MVRTTTKIINRAIAMDKKRDHFNNRNKILRYLLNHHNQTTLTIRKSKIDIIEISKIMSI